MENEVDTMIKTLNNIGQFNELSAVNALLGQTFSNIENHATSDKNSFIQSNLPLRAENLVKLNTFFKHIKGDLRDIDDWKTEVYPIIKKIQEFMEIFKVLKNLPDQLFRTLNTIVNIREYPSFPYDLYRYFTLLETLKEENQLSFDVNRDLQREDLTHVSYDRIS